MEKPVVARPIDAVDAVEMVIVRFKKANGHYFPGDVAGFGKDLAAALVAKKIAEYHGAPAATEETFAAPQPANDPNAIEIPENWEGLHHLSRHKIATAIAGTFTVPDDKKPMDVADEIIRTELARRAAANQPAQTGETAETGGTAETDTGAT